MKRNLVSGFSAAVVLTALAAAGCAHGNGSEKASVRVVSNAQEVAGCEKLSQVRLSGTWTSGAGREELESLVRSKGGNVLLLEAGSSNSGVAYRCSGGASASNN
ncbi:MAG: hypothetical protein ACM3SU_15845 [Acidobacteriota bacterium]